MEMEERNHSFTTYYYYQNSSSITIDIHEELSYLELLLVRVVLPPGSSVAHIWRIQVV